MGKRTNNNTYCIYVHIFPNGKRYVGQTCVDPDIRWRNGTRYSGLMKKAIDKYGWENIVHEILFTELNADQANEIEREIIKQMRTTNPDYGYNITSGGDGYRGASHSEKTRKILREKAHKQWERQKKEGYTPPPITEEHRKHLSESHIGQPAWNKGKHTMTNEMKENLRMARKKYWEEWRRGKTNETES